MKSETSLSTIIDSLSEIDKRLRTLSDQASTIDSRLFGQVPVPTGTLASGKEAANGLLDSLETRVNHMFATLGELEQYIYRINGAL